MEEADRSIREAIATCRQAGSEKRFEEALCAADDAINIASAISSDGRYIRLYAVALSYKGMSLLQMKRFDESVLALEEAYRLFQEHPPRNNMQLVGKVESSLVQVCIILNRDPPLPTLIKYPRTAHLFRPSGSKAVTDDDLVLSKDDAMFKLLASDDNNINISLEEKIDGANLGLSLSLDGAILVQNRSHYISRGEHAQFSQLTAWTEMHREEIKRILEPSPSDEPHLQARRVLYGEWVVAKHSIPYARLPGYFLAFDILGDDRFMSRRQFHSMMNGSGIPVSPTLDPPNMVGLQQKEMEGVLMNLLNTPSEFRTDGGPIEGIVFRVDDGNWMQHRCKLVRPDFTGGITGNWAKSRIEKQRVDANFASDYLERCYQHSEAGIPDEIKSPRRRAVVTYGSNNERSGDGGEDQVRLATATMLPREPSVMSSAPRQGVIVLPRNLCWLWTDEVLVSSTPKSLEQVLAVHDALNIGLVITLTEEEPLPSEWFTSGNCENYFRPIPNMLAPTLHEMDDIADDIVRAIANGNAVLQHCGGGKGRAGTIAACLLLRFGHDGIRARIRSENTSSSGLFLRPRPPFMTGEEAIVEIRRRRPGSLETSAQENFVREYAHHLWRVTAEALEDPFTEDSSENEVRGDDTVTQISTRKRRVPKYVVLCGLPGSGKTELARGLVQDGGRRDNQWTHASTDELGRRECFDLVGRVAASVHQGKAGGIIVDACNITAKHRKEWYDTMHQPDQKSAALVFFDLPMELCISRVCCRVDHPTIPFGRGDQVVKTFAKNLELPSAKESEMFGDVVILRSREDIESLCAGWGVAL